MPPKIINVDEQAAEGAIIYVIGGRNWYAAEPNLDTFKSVLAAAPDNTPTAEGAARDPAAARKDTEDSLDSMVPQLQLLLRACDENNQPTAEEPTAEFLALHLSVKRAGNILKEVLGEGQGAAA